MYIIHTRLSIRINPSRKKRHKLYKCTELLHIIIFIQPYPEKKTESIFKLNLIMFPFTREIKRAPSVNKRTFNAYVATKLTEYSQHNPSKQIRFQNKPLVQKNILHAKRIYPIKLVKVIKK